VESSYDGAYKNNMRHGKGKFVWGDGDVYDGEWANDEMHGEGSMYWGSTNKQTFKGQWRRGERGQGRITD
jgi:hypothetical protein